MLSFQNFGSLQRTCILLLITLSLILYLFSSQLLSQSSTGGDVDHPSDFFGVVKLKQSSDSGVNADRRKLLNTNRKMRGKGGEIASADGITMPMPRRTSQDSQPNSGDWMRLRHRNSSSPSPYALLEFRELAVKQQRQAIEREMKGYKFPEVSGKTLTLNSLIMEKGGQPIRNIILTTWRSGSTFLGEALNSHPGTFYHYEPLIHFGGKQVRSGDLAKEGLRVLSQLLNCNYTNLTDYVNSVKTRSDVFPRNTRVWQYCKRSSDVCWDTQFLSEMCRLFPFQSVKTVRMRLRLAKILLDNKKFNIRILLLVRDPRGTMQSRNHVRDWCGKPDCSEPKLLCMDLVEDFTFAEKFRVQYPDRFLAIRYEDLSLSPYASMQKIFRFFRLQYHPQVEKFLRSHTTRHVPDAYGTFRNSKTTAFHWRNDFIRNFSLVTDIQNSCNVAMKLWGYNPVSDQDQLVSFNPLGRPPWQEMYVLNKTSVSSHLSNFKRLILLTVKLSLLLT